MNLLFTFQDEREREMMWHPDPKLSGMFIIFDFKKIPTFHFWSLWKPRAIAVRHESYKPFHCCLQDIFVTSTAEIPFQIFLSSVIFQFFWWAKFFVKFRKFVFTTFSISFDSCKFTALSSLPPPRANFISWENYLISPSMLLIFRTSSSSRSYESVLTLKLCGNTRGKF